MINHFIKILIFTFCIPLLLVAQEHHIVSANALAEQGHYDEALNAINKVIQAEPNSARAYKIRGHVYIAQKNYHKALGDLSKVIALAPHQAKPYVDRAIIHFKMGNIGLALADISTAQQIDPKDGWIIAVRDKIINENY